MPSRLGRRAPRAARILVGLALGGAAPASACGPSTRPLDVPTALVLSGGGAKGAYEAGVAAVFVERGLPIRLVAGSSAGALNAAMIVDGRMERLEALWRGLVARSGLLAADPRAVRGPAARAGSPCSPSIAPARSSIRGRCAS